MRDEKINEYKKVLEELNKENINYALLRNYEFLIDQTYPVEGLDIIVAEKDFSLFHSLLLTLGFTKRQPQFSLKHKAYFKIINTKFVSFDAQMGGIYWNDMKYLGEEVLTHRQKKEFFFVLSDDDTFIMLLVHSIIGKRYFKEKYQRLLSSLAVNKEYVLGHLSKIFTPEIAKRLFSDAQNENFSRTSIYPLVILFIFRRFFHLATFSKLFLRWLIWKKLLTPAPLISILGPDGAGKSTLVKALHDHLKETGRKTAIVYTGRGRGHLLPITKIGNLYKRTEKKHDAGKIKDSLSKKTPFQRKVLYIASAPIFTFDLLLRYFFKIFPKRLFHTIVITDRYSFDIMLMENVPLGFRKFLLSLFPKPTITILLYNDVDELLKRRPLENRANLGRQLEIYHQFHYSLKLKTDTKENVHKTVIEDVYGRLLKGWW
ncbi:hypothetical protein J4421_03280 [Candidatus Woesearchaeota archaeon]|nr:hypothetical protein [Candidatus Woesearchaeota archaeon]